MQELSKSKLYEIEKVSNFRKLIDRSASLYADKVAFTYKVNPKDTNYITHTYKELQNDVKNLGTALLNLGLLGKRVAIIAPNRYEWCVSYLSITTSGMIVVPLDKALPENEIKSSIIRAKVEAVIFDKKYIDIFSKLKQEDLSCLKQYICMDLAEDFNSIISYKNLLLQGKELVLNGDNSYDNIKIDETGMTIMLFTSGTTSIAKIVMLSQANICANIYSTGCIAKVTKDDTFLSFLPLHHTYESTTTFLYGLYSGITIAFCDGLRYVSQNLKEYKITGFVCVPLILEAMYKKIKKGIKDKHMQFLFTVLIGLSNFLLLFGIDIRRKLFKSILNELGGYLRLVIYGAAPMDKSTIKGLKNIGIELLNGYGLTEASPIVSAENDKYQKPGSVAFALPNVQIKIDEPNEQGIGEIVVKGPNIMLGYYDNKEATDEVLIDGWFHTGDLGYYDKEGYLFITGRKKNVIVLKNGKNIYPEELEILISRLPYVKENIVYGKPTYDNDLEINAKIVYNLDYMKQNYSNIENNDYKKIIWNDIKELNKQMPAYKHIRNIIITDEPMIKTTTQKVKRNEELKKILGK